MKKAVFIIMSLFAIANGAFSQNKIDNHSFVNRAFGVSNSKPDDVSGMKNGWCSDWDDAGVATSDWFKAEGTNIRVQEDIGGGIFTDISGSDGTGYAGLISGEMIQTETNFSGDRIARQRIKLKIRISDKSLRFNGNEIDTVDTGPFVGNETTNLNVYISKNKMSQISGGVWCNPINGTTVQYEEGAIQIASLPISLALYPSGQWHEIETEFTPPLS